MTMESDVQTQHDTDPMDGADVGETRTIRETVELHSIDFKPDVYFGTDRLGNAEIEDVEIVEDEDGYEKLAVTFKGDVTKALPRRWDTAREPRTEAEEKAQRRKQWAKRAASVVATIAPIGIALFITNHVMQQMVGKQMLGETVQPPGIEMYAVIGGMTLFILWALQYLPGMAGRRMA